MSSAEDRERHFKSIKFRRGSQLHHALQEILKFLAKRDEAATHTSRLCVERRLSPRFPCQGNQQCPNNLEDQSNMESSEIHRRGKQIFYGLICSGSEVCSEAQHGEAIVDVSRRFIPVIFDGRVY